MEMNTGDYLKKALLETQERVRDFNVYSSKIEDDELSRFFKEYAVAEGKQANKLMNYIDAQENK